MAGTEDDGIYMYPAFDQHASDNAPDVTRGGSNIPYYLSLTSNAANATNQGKKEIIDLQTERPYVYPTRVHYVVKQTQR